MKLLKTVGILTVLAVCSLAGFYMAGKLKNRACALRKICIDIKKLSEKIACGGRELSAVLPESFSDCGFLEFDGSCVKIHDSPLSAEDTEILNEFFAELGKGEISDELKRSELYYGIFKSRSDAAFEEYGAKNKIYAVTGVCTGIAAAVLFI